MDLQEIRKHWSSWAQSYGTSVRATTRGRTAKILEIEALARHLEPIVGSSGGSVLEVGCGNGVNCVSLAQRFPLARFDGIDLIPEMVEAARENTRSAGVTERTRFLVGNILELDQMEELDSAYDLVFTDRCLINLNTAELQGRAIGLLAGKLSVGGSLFMIENSLETFGRQNDARFALGLEPREPSSFNRFFAEDEMQAHLAAAGLQLDEIEDFSSLHDLVLYALVPATNGGEVDYDHLLVEAATRLSAELPAARGANFGAFGQNRLYICSKPFPPAA